MKHLGFVISIAALTLTACADQSASQHDNVHETRAQSILAQMTLEEKIGQILQADISAVTPEEAKTYNLGSVLNGGSSAPGGGKVAAPDVWIALTDEFWDASSDKSDGGVGVPLLWGTDAVHGHNNLQTATIFPHNIGLGAANDPGLIERIAQVTAKEIRATGIDWTFAPTLAVAQDDRWGRTYESYSENPAIVASYAGAMVRGLQGDKNSPEFLKGEFVIATAKHFVGDGGTTLGIDKGDTQGDMKQLLELHAAGYAPAFEAGAQTVMASFSSINGEKMHGHKNLLTDVLRGEMGFDGFVVGDWNGHAEIPGCTATDCPQALDAGVDMYMAPESWRGMYDSLLAHANAGDLDLARLDEAVVRILTVKARSGLLDSQKPSLRKSSNTDNLGSDENRAVAREAARKSLVLLKNNGGALPLQPGQNVLVTGSGADSIQKQTGGWTLNWQGDDNTNDEFFAAESIYAGLNAAMTDIDGTAQYSPDGTFESPPDAAVIVFGEEPYAEYRGDVTNLVYGGSDDADLALLRQYKAAGVPVVSVFLSGRPMWVNPHLNASDAFVAAWLPGTEGGGIADVLVADQDGATRNDFNGRLSFSWPATGEGTPINGPEAEGALFPLGFGLTYADDSELATLSEESGVDISSSFDGSIITRGDAVSPMTIYVGDSSNANVPVLALIGESLGGGVSTRGLDYKVQEDARAIQWSGNGKASYSVRFPQAFDLTKNGSVAQMELVLEGRIDKMPEAPLTIAMRCGEGCSGSIDVSELMASAERDNWGEIRIPLQCFIEAGLDPRQVVEPLRFETDGKAELAIYSAKLVSSPDLSPNCP